jgi:hypothetical protein
MTTTEIAARLKELCSQGQFEQVLNELFSPDAVSIEPYAGNGFEKETKGLDAIKAKGAAWNTMVEEQYGFFISDPVVADNSFALAMGIDVKMKGRDRHNMKEICLYKVKDGKIISEEFFM